MTTEGQGGSIPLCNVLAETYPDAEIMLLGVEEPQVPHPRAERERRPGARSSASRSPRRCSCASTAA